MPLTRARFHQFRNLVDSEIELGAHQVFLLGENGQGKTNLLEGIYVAHLGSSFRTRIDSQLARQGTSAWSVRGTFETEGETHVVLVRFGGSKKEIFLDSRQVHDRKVLIEIETTVVFGHEDYRLVSGPMEERRRFFDQTLSLLSEEYLENWREYHRLLKQRNALLRTDPDKVLLDTLEFQMAERASQIQRLRSKYTLTLGSIFVPVFEAVSGLLNVVSIVYRPDVEEGRWREEWRESRKRDMEKGYTQRGPHRDRWMFLWNDTTFSQVASTGQIRLASLALKLAQAKSIREALSRPLTVLLDDVLLELDPARRRIFMGLLPRMEQAIYTFLDEGMLASVNSSLEKTLLYRMENGCWRKYGHV